MDYSSHTNDPDNPVGSSPWQSSPQASSHPNFGTPEPGSAPSSPLAKHSTPYTEPSPQQSDDGSPQDGLDRRQRTEDGSLSADDGSPQATPRRQQGPPLNGKGMSPGHLRHLQQEYLQQQRQEQIRQQSGQSQQQQHQPRSAVPSRYHTAPRANQRQNLPQYKLQAKITNLERTGRKDPVLRFDVHVSQEPPSACEMRADSPSDESAQIPNDPIPRCRSNTFRVRQTCRPLDLCQSRGFRARSTPVFDCCRGRNSRG